MDKPIPQLAPGMEHLSLFEHHSKLISAIIPVGVTPEDILHPEFWSHHAKFLLPNDEIRARALDGTWTAYLIVRDSTRTSTTVHLRQLINFEAKEQISDQELLAFINAHDVVHRGPLKWSVVRKADKAVLVENIVVKTEAHAWLEKTAREQLGMKAAA
jgi:hypothetical protein